MVGGYINFNLNIFANFWGGTDKIKINCKKDIVKKQTLCSDYPFYTKKYDGPSRKCDRNKSLGELYRTVPTGPRLVSVQAFWCRYVTVLYWSVLIGVVAGSGVTYR